MQHFFCCFDYQIATRYISNDISKSCLFNSKFQIGHFYQCITTDIYATKEGDIFHTHNVPFLTLEENY